MNSDLVQIFEYIVNPALYRDTVDIDYYSYEDICMNNKHFKVRVISI
jgi:hypothetical protein